MIDEITDFLFEDALDALGDNDAKSNKRRKTSPGGYLVGFAMLAVLVFVVYTLFY